MYNYGISSEPLLGSNETSLKYHLRGSKITKNDFEKIFSKIEIRKKCSVFFRNRFYGLQMTPEPRQTH